MAVTQNLVPAVVSGLGGLATALAGAPWWTTVLCLGLTLIVTSLQLVFPQESRDRLAWWEGPSRVPAGAARSPPP